VLAIERTRASSEFVAAAGAGILARGVLGLLGWQEAQKRV
jgi:hypothetical protein